MMLLLNLLLSASLAAALPIVDKPGGISLDKDNINHKVAKDYMRSYGYMKPDTEEMEEYVIGMKRLQRHGGLAETGELDEPTKILMSTPRCGTPEEFEDDLSEQYELSKLGKWGKTSLTYEVLNFPDPDQIGEDTIRDIVGDALNTWADVSALKFTEVEANGDIKVSFQSRDHGDGASFDGPMGILAHAFFPHTGYDGQAHFDAEEHFATEASKGIDLQLVATHEFGHSLGLRHSSKRAAIMFPWYHPIPVIKLNKDDIDGIRAIYGHE